MSHRLPDGDLAPTDGRLPEGAVSGLGERRLAVYVHVPFCETRCGYCDFNTYTWRAPFREPGLAELQLAWRVLGGRPPVSTVFFGGGTPTLLPVAEIAALIEAVEPAGEVTVEANPESVDARYLRGLRAAGATRVSFGMQSAVAHVLEVLERGHAPGRTARAVEWARAAGFDQVSVDLIYGTPGESDGDWQASLDAALELEPDHVSAYALTIEPGTRMAARVRRGELPPPDEDAQARRYEMADERLSAAGLDWYELSNWGRPCAHNLGYWRGGDWWGVGPGAHSHVGGVRWWNRLHPIAWAAELRAGRSPAAGREVLDASARELERVMLGLRLAEGVRVQPAALERAERLRGLVDVDWRAGGDGVVTLTRRGRLLADLVARELAGSQAMMALKPSPSARVRAAR